MIIIQNRKKQEVVVSTADLSGILLRGSMSTLDNVNLSGANLSDVNFKSTSIQNANLSGANLSNGIFDGVGFINTNLSNTNFEGSTFIISSLEVSDLSGANLKNTDLTGVSFAASNLRGANLTGAKNLHEDINTKEKLIAQVGAENVNAETIWIDGTSILD